MPRGKKHLRREARQAKELGRDPRAPRHGKGPSYCPFCRGHRLDHPSPLCHDPGFHRG